VVPFLTRDIPLGVQQRRGMVTFSSEPGNLRSLNAAKYSGLIQSKTVGIAPTPEGDAITMVLGTKKGYSQPAKGQVVIPLNKNFRSCVKSISKTALADTYRPDLKADALAKYWVSYDSMKRVKGHKKKVPVKTGRNPPKK